MKMINFTDPVWVWTKEAIENGAGRYNTVTGKFEWIKHKTETE